MKCHYAMLYEQTADKVTPRHVVFYVASEEVDTVARIAEINLKGVFILREAAQVFS